MATTQVNNIRMQRDSEIAKINSRAARKLKKIRLLRDENNQSH